MFATARAKTTPESICLADHDAYRHTRDRLQELRTELSETTKAFYAAAGTGTNGGGLKDAAEKLASGENWESVLDSLDNPKARLTRAEELNRKCAVLRAAIAQQEQALDRAAHDASRALIAKYGLRAVYASLLADIFNAAEPFAEAVERERDFRAMLREGQIQFSGELPPNPWNMPLGDAEDSNSVLGNWLAGVRREYPDYFSE